MAKAKKTDGVDEVIVITCEATPAGLYLSKVNIPDLSAGNGDARLEALQGIVGGYIEHVALNGTTSMYFDEEGKIKGKPVNRMATKLARKALGIRFQDVIVGDAVIVKEHN